MSSLIQVLQVEKIKLDVLLHVLHGGLTDYVESGTPDVTEDTLSLKTTETVSQPYK